MIDVQSLTKICGEPKSDNAERAARGETLSDDPLSPREAEITKLVQPAEESLDDRGYSGIPSQSVVAPLSATPVPARRGDTG